MVKWLQGYLVNCLTETVQMGTCKQLSTTETDY
jgi:hypothetical protein